MAIGNSIVTQFTLADLEGAILSFRHTKFFKRNHLGHPRPPTGNPGSATDLYFHAFGFLERIT